MTGQNPQNQELPFMAGLFTACLCTLFGANAVAIKISLLGLGVFTTAGLRFGMASLAVSLWARATGRSFSIKTRQFRQLLIVSSIFTVQLSLFYLGLSKSNASRGTLLVNLQPFFTLFLAHFFIPGDQMTARKIIGILMGFTGVAFVFLERTGVAADFQTGDLIILAASFLWACSAVYIKRIIHAFQPFHIVLYPMIFSAPVFFIEGFFWDGGMIKHIDTAVMVALLYQGLVTASFCFVMPISGVVLGGLILGEPITYKIVVAMLLIVSGILVVHVKQKKLIPLFSLGRNI